MAKQIIILGVSDSPDKYIEVRYVFWFSVATAANRVLRPNVVSAWAGASAVEVAQIQSGEIVERTGGHTFPQGTAAAAIKATLLQKWQNEQARFLEPGQFSGVFFDPVSGGWSA